MEYIKRLLETSPQLRCISLDGRDISDLSDLLPLLAQFPDLEDLELSGNRLQSLPDGLGSLKSLKSVNIVDNSFGSLEEVVRVLQGVPGLRAIHLNLSCNADVQLVLVSLPQLEWLNGQEIHPSALSPPVEDPAAKPAEESPGPEKTVDDVNSIYERIVELKAKRHVPTDSAFSTIQENIMISAKKEALEESVRALKKSILWKAKFDVLGACAEETLELLGDPDLVSLLTAIRAAQNVAVESMLRETRQAEFSELAAGYRSELEKARRELAENVEIIAQCEDRTKDAEKKKSESEARSHKECDDLRAQIAILETENRRYLDIVVRHAKNAGGSPLRESVSFMSSRAELSVSTGQRMDGRRTSTGHSPINVAGPGRGLNTSPNAGKNGPLFRSGSRSRGTINGNFNAISQSPSKAMSSRTVAKSATESVGPRTLSLRQLKEIISDICTQKVRFDAKCREAKQPQETMEQYMYTYLNQHYGLKSLILDWATAILNAIAQFSAEDTEVGVFGKILKNECEEWYRDVLYKIRDEFDGVIKDVLRRRLRHKNEGELQDLLLKYTSEDKPGLEPQLWNEVLGQMCEPADAAKVKERIKAMVRERSLGQFLTGNAEKKAAGKVETGLRYAEFLKLMMDFHLARHDKFISPFVMLFKSADSDTNGIINQDEFRAILLAMGDEMKVQWAEEEVLRMIGEADPSGQQQITFSQCVSLFTKTKVEGVTIMERLAQT